MPAAVIVPLIVGAATIGASLYEASAAQRQQSQALAEQTQATQAQERASRAAEEDAQLQASGQDASARIGRSAGLRVLQFGGSSAAPGAVATSLGGTTRGTGTTLGG